MFLGIPYANALHGNIGIHDPSSIIKCGDTYWIFGTGNGIYSICDKSIFIENWIIPAGLNLEQALFTIDGKNVTLKYFAEYITDQDEYTGNMTLEKYVHFLNNQFVSIRLITYEYYKLEQKYPEFHLQFQEYRDAMFLIEITKNEFQFVVVNEVLNPSVKTFSESLEYENLNPSYYGMVAIQRVELSEGQHHIGSYFSDHVGIQTEKESLKATAAKGGITVLNHPSLNQ